MGQGTGNRETRNPDATDADAKYGSSPFGFQDLEAYRAARSLRNQIYELAKKLPPAEEYALARQMRRAAASLTNNIAEGYGRFTWQDTTHFCRQSRGSLMELVDDIGICEDQQYASAALLADIEKDALRVLRLLNGYIRYLQESKLSGGGSTGS